MWHNCIQNVGKELSAVLFSVSSSNKGSVSDGGGVGYQSQRTRSFNEVHIGRLPCGCWVASGVE